MTQEEENVLCAAETYVCYLTRGYLMDTAEYAEKEMRTLCGCLIDAVRTLEDTRLKAEERSKVSSRSYSEMEALLGVPPPANTLPNCGVERKW